MISRRSFVAVTAAGAAGSLVGASFAAEPQAPGALPPSIAELKSMRDKAQPVSKDERRQRIERARQLMVENRLDAIMLTSGTSMQYFTGMRWSGAERLFAAVVPAKGAAFFVCPAFEEDRAREQIALSPLDAQPDVRPWHEDQSPYERVAQGLRERGVSSGTLGIEETTKYVFAEGVGKAAPQLRMASATPVTAGCRQIKSAHELALMQLANNVTLAAFEAAYKAVREGMTHNQFAELIATAHARLGFPGGGSLVNVDKYAALPHGSVTPTVIREGSLVLIDGGCEVEGYESDISRTFVVGKPTDKMKQVFDVVHKAQSAALAAAKPGVQCQAVDAAARKVIDDAGFGPEYAHFTHRVGHGIGMDGHEWPYLVRGNTLPMAAGMTFSDEPGVYIRGEFGVRLEDDMHITSNGAELFTPQSPSLEHPFARG
jgi:Xaa-Pro dipeptidase